MEWLKSEKEFENENVKRCLENVGFFPKDESRGGKRGKKPETLEETFQLQLDKQLALDDCTGTKEEKQKLKNQLANAISCYTVKLEMDKLEKACEGLKVFGFSLQ